MTKGISPKRGRMLFLVPVMLIALGLPGLAQERARPARPLTGAPESDGVRRPASPAAAQIDAADQLDQARMAMIHGDYLAAQMHMREATGGADR